MNRDGAAVSNLPSVTQILGDVFGRNRFWTDEGRYEGKLVHAFLALDNRGRLDLKRLRQQMPDYVGYIEGWRRIRPYFGNVLAVEKEVRTPLYVGHVDTALQHLIDDRMVIVDYKRGAVEASHPLQTAAYAMAYGIPLYRIARACVYLDPDPSKCQLVSHDKEQDHDDWNAVLAAWYAVERRKGWKGNEQ